MKNILRIEKNIPLETPRLLLDKFVQSDWKDYLEIEVSPEEHRYNHEIYCPRTKEQIKESVKEMSARDYDNLNLPMLFAIRKMDTKKMIGFIGLKNGELKEKGAVEVFYSVNKTCWNNGFGTEALRRIVKFGFETIGLHRVFSGCDIENIASKKIMEKVGMRFESRWRKDRIRNGRWTDGLGFAILEEDILE